MNTFFTQKKLKSKSVLAWYRAQLDRILELMQRTSPGISLPEQQVAADHAEDFDACERGMSED